MYVVFYAVKSLFSTYFVGDTAAISKEHLRADVVLLIVHPHSYNLIGKISASRILVVRMVRAIDRIMYVPSEPFRILRSNLVQKALSVILQRVELACLFVNNYYKSMQL